MHQLSAEARTTYVADAIAEILRHTPDLSWQDIVAINDGPGWEYELPWYEQDSPARSGRARAGARRATGAPGPRARVVLVLARERTTPLGGPAGSHFAARRFR